MSSSPAASKAAPRRSRMGRDKWNNGNKVVVAAAAAAATAAATIAAAAASADRYKTSPAGLGSKAPPPPLSQVRSMMSFAPAAAVKYVPDPYYGGPDGFEKARLH